MRRPAERWNDPGMDEPSAVPAPSEQPAPGRRRSRRHPVLRWSLRIGLAAIALFALAQLVPYGRSHTNPPVRAEPRWSSPQTRALVKKACFDCHSNETTWPWYSNVAPVSWLVQSDVSGGRSALNFSDWNRPHEGAGDVVEAVSGGSMPPWYYTIQHPNAKLSSADKQALMAGLATTLRNSPPVGGGG
jgi:hypothetical protein